MNTIRLLILLTALVISCTSQNEDKTQTDLLLLDSNAVSQTAQSDSPQSYQLTGSDTVLVHLVMDSIGHHDTISFHISTQGCIHGFLNANDKTANIRFTQIALPNGTFDGPFGKELKYEAKQTGLYKVITGQNLMAENAWKGPYKVRLVFQPI